MSVHDKADWLVAYDIAEPRRGARLLRLLKRHGVPLQYSVFAVHATGAQMHALMREINGLICPATDDVRAYRLPVGAHIRTLGAGCLPDGVLVTACRPWADDPEPAEVRPVRVARATLASGE